MKHCTASARVCLLALPLVQLHPPARLHQRSLSRVRSLQAVPQGGILRVSEPVGSVSLQGRKLPDQAREVAGCVPGYVLRLLRPYLEEPSILTRSGPNLKRGRN